MPSSVSESCVGDWRISPSVNRISRSGEIVQLKPRSMQVLVCLIQADGEVVTRDELLDSVWHGMSVTDDVLTQSIVELRRAFGDDAKNARYVETIPKVGFRLIAPSLPYDQNQLASERSRSFLVGVAALAAVLAIGVVWILLAGDDRSSRTRIVQVDPPPSIAVLPFTNTSNDPSNEFFADGLSEEILNLLAKTPDLKVIGRTSSFAYKGKSDDIRTIGTALGVTSLLEGSVQKFDNRVKVYAQLVDVADGSQMWSGTYERELQDIFAVQEEVAAAIIGALHMQTESGPSRGRPTRNMEAYSLFLKARISINRYENSEAERQLMEAIRLDPQFGEAYELLAYCDWLLCGPTQTVRESELRMFDSAARALEINPDLSFAEAINGYGSIRDYTNLDLLAAFESAARKDPNNVAILDALSWYLLLFGYLEEGYRVADYFAEVDPGSMMALERYYSALGATGRFAEARSVISVYDKTGGDSGDWFRAKLAMNQGRTQDAIASYEAWSEVARISLTDLIAELVSMSENPDRPAEYLDREIEKILLPLSGYRAARLREFLNQMILHFGLVDPYIESIANLSPESPDSAWEGYEFPMYEGTVNRGSGFTAHPRYLELARDYGFVELWEQRGPPDFCEKRDARWLCH